MALFFPGITCRELIVQFPVMHTVFALFSMFKEALATFRAALRTEDTQCPRIRIFTFQITTADQAAAVKKTRFRASALLHCESDLAGIGWCHGANGNGAMESGG